MNICNGLRIDSHTRLALVGSGGKTTIMFNIGRELAAPIVLTTTTHLSMDEVARSDRHVMALKEQDIERIFKQPVEGVLLLTGAPTEQGNRVRGLSEAMMDVLKNVCDQKGLPLLIEADGSRRLPLKAAGEYEPVIPQWVNQTAVVVGLRGLGKKLGEDTVFRADRFAALCDAHLGDVISPDLLEQYLLSPLGGLKNIPDHAVSTIFFNQLDIAPLSDETQQAWAKRFLSRYNRVLWGSANSTIETQRVAARDEAITAIVLAAGRSSRFGHPKQLLEWRGQPFIRHVVNQSLQSGIQSVIVVVGEKGAEIASAIQDLSVEIVYNHEWAQGLSQSIKAGLAALPRHAGGALFLMSDIPQIPVALINAIVATKRKEEGLIFAPRTKDGFVNPVLFDRACFADLMSLTGERGGKALFQQYPVREVLWEHEDELRDIDTPDDYAWLKQLE